MAGQSIALATKGIIFCPQDITTRVTRCVIPFSLKLKTDIFKLNLNSQPSINLNSVIDKKKLSLNLSQSKLSNTLAEKFKLNLKKCED